MIAELPERADLAQLAGREADTVELTAQERRHARRRVVTRAGRVLTLQLPPGAVLAPGALLHVGVDFYVTVQAAAEPLLAVAPRSPREVAVHQRIAQREVAHARAVPPGLERLAPLTGSPH